MQESPRAAEMQMEMTTLSATEAEGHRKGENGSNSLELRSLAKSLFDVKNVQFAFRTTFKRRENSLRSSIIVTGLWCSDHSQTFKNLTTRPRFCLLTGVFPLDWERSHDVSLLQEAVWLGRTRVRDLHGNIRSSGNDSSISGHSYHVKPS